MELIAVEGIEGEVIAVNPAMVSAVRPWRKADGKEMPNRSVLTIGSESLRVRGSMMDVIRHLGFSLAGTRDVAAEPKPAKPAKAGAGVAFRDL